MANSKGESINVNTSNINPAVQAYNIGAEYIVEFGIKSGLSGKQHAGIIVRFALWAFEHDLDKFAMHVGMLAIENGSALRQKFEKNGLLEPKAQALSENYV